MASYLFCLKEKFRSSWRLILFILLVLIVFAVGEGPWDPIADWYRETGQNPFLFHIALFFSRWGDFWPGGLALCLGLLGLSWLCGSLPLRRASVISLMAALCAGGFSLILKTTLGRARPNIAHIANLGDQFHGLAWHSSLHSFPSGHTATAFAIAMTFVLLLPEIGWLAFFVALLVGWSRIYVGAHYFGDVLTGAWIGSISAWLAVVSFHDWKKKQNPDDIRKMV